MHGSLQDQNAKDQRHKAGVNLKMRGQILDPDQTDHTYKDQERSECESVAVDPLKV